MPDTSTDAGALAEGPVPERFIPVRQSDLVRLLDEAERLPPEDQERFRALAELLDAMFHFAFRSRLETLKDAYAPFAHDPDTRAVITYDDEDRARAQQQLLEGMEQLLEDANFERVEEAEIERAFEEESLLSVKVEVDLDEFEHLLVYRRGLTERQEEVESWRGLRKRTVRFTNNERVLMLVTFRDEAHWGHRQDDIDALPFEPGSTIIKLFQDVPSADIEMLFPNTQVRMRWVDKLLIGVPAFISGVIILTTKLATTIGLLFLLVGFYVGMRDEPVDLDQATLITLGAGLGSVGGYLTRQFTKFKARKMEFMKTLADNLYFRNLDNNAGVFHHLLDAAEEEEVKEAVCSWYFLRAAGRPLTAAELDDAVESWFAEELDIDIDFEVDDGLEKLRHLGLVDEDDDRLRAVPAEEALRRLDERWDGYVTERGLRSS